MQSRSSNGDARSPGGGRAGGITAPTATDFCRALCHGRGPTGRGAAASGGVLARDGVAPHGCGVPGLTAWHVFSCATYSHATTTCHGTGYGASAPESQAFETRVLVRGSQQKRPRERLRCEIYASTISTPTRNVGSVGLTRIAATATTSVPPKWRPIETIGIATSLYGLHLRALE